MNTASRPMVELVLSILNKSSTKVASEAVWLSIRSLMEFSRAPVVEVEIRQSTPERGEAESLAAQLLVQITSRFKLPNPADMSDQLRTLVIRSLSLALDSRLADENDFDAERQLKNLQKLAEDDNFSLRTRTSPPPRIDVHIVYEQSASNRDTVTMLPLGSVKSSISSDSMYKIVERILSKRDVSNAVVKDRGIGIKVIQADMKDLPLVRIVDSKLGPKRIT